MAARQLPIHERFRDLMGAFHEALDDRAQSSVLQRARDQAAVSAGAPESELT
jgi:hypothetical protein